MRFHAGRRSGLSVVRRRYITAARFEPSDLRVRLSAATEFLRSGDVNGVSWKWKKLILSRSPFSTRSVFASGSRARSIKSDSPYPAPSETESGFSWSGRSYRTDSSRKIRLSCAE